MLFFMDERGDSVLFHLNAAQRISGMVWEGGDHFRCRRTYKKLETSRALPLRQWVGRYHSQEFKRTVRVRYARGKRQLQLRPVFFLKYPLTALADGVFTIPNEKIIIRFSSDGLVLGHDWVQNLNLQKIK